MCIYININTLLTVNMFIYHHHNSPLVLIGMCAVSAPQGVGVEVSEASLGTAAPKIGLGGTFWATSPHGQVIPLSFTPSAIHPRKWFPPTPPPVTVRLQEELHATFEWMSESLCVQLSLPHSQGGRQVVVDQCRVGGRLKFLPVLDRGALLWAFDSPPAVCLSLIGTGEATAEARSWAVRSVE